MAYIKLEGRVGIQQGQAVWEAKVSNNSKLAGIMWTRTRGRTSNYRLLFVEFTDYDRPDKYYRCTMDNGSPDKIDRSPVKPDNYYKRVMNVLFGNA